MYYFAYGSNMLAARLQARCASARVVTTAHVSGFRVVFGKRGRDGSGKATLVEFSGGSRVPGVVFEIDDADLVALDGIEGPGYRRTDGFTVTCTRTGQAIPASTYFARDLVPDLKPFDWYLALVLAGVAEHGLDEAHAARLRDVAYTVDGRSHCDYTALLRS